VGGCTFVVELPVDRRTVNRTPDELGAFYTLFVMLQFWNLLNGCGLGSTRSAFSGIAENSPSAGGPLSLRDRILIVVGASVVLVGRVNFVRPRRRVTLTSAHA
jgi:hypothetical protein